MNSKKTMEINPLHPIVRTLQAKVAADKTDSTVKDLVWRCLWHVARQRSVQEGAVELERSTRRRAGCVRKHRGGGAGKCAFGAATADVNRRTVPKPRRPRMSQISASRTLLSWCELLVGSWILFGFGSGLGGSRVSVTPLKCRGRERAHPASSGTAAACGRASACSSAALRSARTCAPTPPPPPPPSPPEDAPCRARSTPHPLLRRPSLPHRRPPPPLRSSSYGRASSIKSTHFTHGVEDTIGNRDASWERKSATSSPMKSEEKL